MQNCYLYNLFIFPINFKTTLCGFLIVWGHRFGTWLLLGEVTTSPTLLGPILWYQQNYLSLLDCHVFLILLGLLPHDLPHEEKAFQEEKLGKWMNELFTWQYFYYEFRIGISVSYVLHVFNISFL